MADDTPFLARWSRRKAESRRAAPAAPAPVQPSAGDTTQPRAPDAQAASPATVRESQTPAGAPGGAPARAPAAPSLPTLADVAQLTRESDYARFVAPGVDDGVKQAAMKKLFSDPHFNVMDGLDTYIDDYGKPNPIPMAVLRQMAQSKALGLFDADEPDAAAETGAARARSPDAADPLPPEAESTPTPDDDADLQLQQDHAAGRPGPGEGAGA
ncbi:DUF3306 domain-containing protein [Aquabacterium humicola]|uniref:DUF3306 domain-containing protein n=1 Tax=Aquabacterium humicola TaxID=3237377 RepID=UPI0025438291|nr:DUF3306 domain-containing protein [Rubrivivax pictus]